MTEQKTTVGVQRGSFELTVVEFTPGGKGVQLVITQNVGPLEDEDIRRILQRAAKLIPPEPESAPEPAELPPEPSGWTRGTALSLMLRVSMLLVLGWLLLAALFHKF